MGILFALKLLFASAIICLLAVACLSRFAPALRLVDQPGGRKVHAHPVPLVGGLAIYLSLLLVAWLAGVATSAGYFLFALSIVLAAGLWDDAAEISPGLKFAIQIAASVIMIAGAGVVLRSVGDLLGWRPIGLWVFAVPLTVFAIVGVVNAMNMMDGIDGLAGSIALAAFGWYALVAGGSGLAAHAALALILCGALAGFLLLNLRLPWQPHARAFLGDAGSLMIGFALGWLAVDLTQGEDRGFPPIAALWVLMLPLIDCVSVMVRRLRAGRSPFDADRHHIHHYLLARGFTQGQTLVILVGLSTLFGGIGYLAWRLDVAQAALFYPFFFGYFTYHFWIQRAWKCLEERDRDAAKGPLAHEDEKVAPAA